jgi:hypothetical protein
LIRFDMTTHSRCAIQWQLVLAQWIQNTHALAHGAIQ